MKKILSIISLLMAFSCCSLDASEFYVLSASPTSACPGQSRTISWVTPSTANTSEDWIGWYHPETPTQVTRFIDIGGSHSGSFTYTANTPGIFFLKYYRGTDGVAQCDAIAITNRSDCYIVTVNPNNVTPCEVFTVSWSTPSGVNLSGDWIGWYRQGTPNEITHFIDINGRQFGSETFTAHNVGNYCFQYYRGTPGVALNDCVPFTISFDPSAQTFTTTNHTVAVGEQVHVDWHSIACLCNANDMVGYYDPNHPGTFIAVTGLDGMCDGEICFVMNSPGTFVFGYFRGGDINKPMAPLLSVTVGSQTTTGPPPVLSIQKACCGSVELSWFGQSGAVYDVLRSANLATPRASWTRIATLSGNNSTLYLTCPITNSVTFFALLKH